ncbi:MAG: flagellar brake protein [Methylophilaceae bacterium]
MSKQEVVRPIPQGLIQIGIPIEYPVYDSHGQLLMQVGTVVTTESQLEKLYARGLYLNLKTIEFIKTSHSKNTISADAVKKDDSQTEGEMLVELNLKTINIGESMQVSPLTDDSNSIKYFIKYLGGLDKNSIICSLPQIDEKTVYIKEHSGFAVRLFSGKIVYRFTTIASAVFNKPYPHMHLKFPREVYANKLRKNQRISTSIITSLINKNPGDYENIKSAGRIVDLSLGGAMIESVKMAGNVNDEIECTFKITIDGNEMVYAIPSVVRNILETTGAEDKKMFKHGIQFKEIEFRDKVMLQSYIFQTITGEKLDEL